MTIDDRVHLVCTRARLVDALAIDGDGLLAGGKQLVDVVMIGIVDPEDIQPLRKKDELMKLLKQLKNPAT